MEHGPALIIQMAQFKFNFQLGNDNGDAETGKYIEPEQQREELVTWIDSICLMQRLIIMQRQPQHVR